MLKTKLINPEIISTLAKCGHGDKILIADANYPLDSKTGNANKVYIGLTQNVPTATQVLDALLGEINVESAQVMTPDNCETPQIFSEFKTLLCGMDLQGLSRHDFYNACADENVKLAILTGEKRIYANILITVGVV